MQRTSPKFSVALLLAVALAACATAPTFTRPGASAGDLRRDSYECERDAWTAFPQPLGVGVAPALIVRKHRVDFYSRCMQTRGYQAAAETKDGSAATSTATDRLVQASDSERRSAAVDFVHVSMPSAYFDAVQSQLRDGITVLVLVDVRARWAALPTEADESKIRDVVARVLADVIPVSAMQEFFADVYAQYFTEAELREMIAFYRTPTGAKAARLMPAMVAEFGAFRERMGRAPVLHQRLDEEMRKAFTGR